METNNFLALNYCTLQVTCSPPLVFTSMIATLDRTQVVTPSSDPPHRVKMCLLLTREGESCFMAIGTPRRFSERYGNGRVVTIGFMAE